jgi:mannose-1-phosphate guanylyltransferase
MSSRDEPWAIVLAAGDGRRLAALTVSARGECIPKQYCSLDGRGSLLEQALGRARRVTSAERVCVIVAEPHRPYWRASPWPLPLANVIVQPANRGTANGVLLSLLSILRRDPGARCVFLPADHHVSDERKLASAIIGALKSAAESAALALVGIEPEEADPELGYILPGRALPDGSRRVRAFVEKPTAERARELLAAGALWNSFIFASDGATLLLRLRARMDGMVRGMSAALARDAVAGSGSGALREFYGSLPPVDFSRGVLEPAAAPLRVFTAPRCGWSDLGTPQRVARALRRLRPVRSSLSSAEPPRLGLQVPAGALAPAAGFACGAI